MGLDDLDQKGSGLSSIYYTLGQTDFLHLRSQRGWPYKGPQRAMALSVQLPGSTTGCEEDLCDVDRG